MEEADWEKTGKVFALVVDTIEDTEDSKWRKITFGAAVNGESYLYENVYKFINTPEDHSFKPIYDDNAALRSCNFYLPEMTETDDNVEECMSKLSIEENCCLLEKKWFSIDADEVKDIEKDSIQFLMGEDWSIYAVIKGENHPYNSYDFDQFSSQTNEKYSIQDFALCNKCVWGGSILDYRDNQNTTWGYFGRYVRNCFEENPKTKKTAIKRYGYFVINLKIPETVKQKLQINFLAGAEAVENMMSMAAPMWITMRNSERKTGFLETLNTASLMSKTGSPYAWSTNVFTKETRAATNVIVERKDLFCPQYVNIPTIATLYNKYIMDSDKPERFPIHFDMKLDDQNNIIVNVYIESYHTRKKIFENATIPKGTLTVKTYKRIQAGGSEKEEGDCWEGKVSEISHQPGRKTYDDTIAHYVFTIKSDTYRKLNKDTNIGLKFDWDEQEPCDEFWQLENHSTEQPSPWFLLRGNIKPGKRETTLDCAWTHGVNEKNFTMVPDGANNFKYMTKERTYNGGITFIIREEDGAKGKILKLYSIAAPKGNIGKQDDEQTTTGDTITGICLKVKLSEFDMKGSYSRLNKFAGAIKKPGEKVGKGIKTVGSKINNSVVKPVSEHYKWTDCTKETHISTYNIKNGTGIDLTINAPALKLKAMSEGQKMENDTVKTFFHETHSMLFFRPAHGMSITEKFPLCGIEIKFDPSAPLATAVFTDMASTIKMMRFHNNATHAFSIDRSDTIKLTLQPINSNFVIAGYDETKVTVDKREIQSLAALTRIGTSDKASPEQLTGLRRKILHSNPDRKGIQADLTKKAKEAAELAIKASETTAATTTSGQLAIEPAAPSKSFSIWPFY